MLCTRYRHGCVGIIGLVNSGGVVMKQKYQEAQKLRNQGLTLKEISEKLGINEKTIHANTVNSRKKSKKAPKESNRDKLYTGEVKVKEGLKIFETKKDRDEGKIKVRVNKNTWVYTNKSPEQAIEDYNRRYNV